MSQISDRDETPAGPDPALIDRPGTCWKTAIAPRFAVLMDNEAYFEALASSLSKARKSIVLLGWQFDPRTRLDPETRPDDHQAQIGHQLRMLVKSRPDLDVRLLVWNSPLLIAASQGFYPHRAQGWFRKRLIEFRLDQPGPLGACHHQKVIVIDDAVAFVGGGDVATDRWDNPDHLDDDPRRCMPTGLIAPPRHETMCVMDGEAARVLGDLARERWFRATWERTRPDDTDNDPWPDGVRPDLTDVPVGVSRTEPAWAGRREVREVEALHLTSIESAKSLIYFENQYFTSPRIAAALARRLEEPDGPEVVLVSTGHSPSWFDRWTMDTTRSEILYRLERADHHNRFFAFSPLTRGGQRLIVHAKVTVIDDRLLRIGSANLNNRSMGFDTECDVAAEPITDDGRAVIRRLRQASIAHFIGAPLEAYRAAEEVSGSVGRAIEAFSGGRMQVLGARPPSRLEAFIAEWQLGDPASADDAWRPWKRRNPTQRPDQGSVDDSSKSTISGR